MTATTVAHTPQTTEEGTSVAFVARSVEEAFYGLAGEIVRTIEPHSEADPLAILIQFLVVIGNVVGRGPYFLVEATPHFLNLNALLVGDTSKSRKGTSWGHVLRLFKSPNFADSGWLKRVRRGLSSGEGLIYAVRDPRGKDQGVSDKRLLAQEGEFAFALEVMKREGNTLSQVLRDAWDGVPVLSTLTKKSPLEATNAHVSVIGHITAEELRRKFDRTELANGFANRFLIPYVRRSKVLPTGGSLTDEQLAPLTERIEAVRAYANKVKRMQFDAEAARLWRDIYVEMSEAKPGVIGAITARAEAQVIRLACIYALLDLSAVVRPQHLVAAHALWKYCEASVEFVFSYLESDSTAQTLLKALRDQGSSGMTETEIRDLFDRHRSERIDAALDVLERLGLAMRTRVPTGGRPATRWYATEATKPVQAGDGSPDPDPAATGVPHV